MDDLEFDPKNKPISINDDDDEFADDVDEPLEAPFGEEDEVESLDKLIEDELDEVDDDGPKDDW